MTQAKISESALRALQETEQKLLDNGFVSVWQKTLVQYPFDTLIGYFVNLLTGQAVLVQTKTLSNYKDGFYISTSEVKQKKLAEILSESEQIEDKRNTVGTDKRDSEFMRGRITEWLSNPTGNEIEDRKNAETLKVLQEKWNSERKNVVCEELKRGDIIEFIDTADGYTKHWHVAMVNEKEIEFTDFPDADTPYCYWTRTFEQVAALYAVVVGYEPFIEDVSDSTKGE